MGVLVFSGIIPLGKNNTPGVLGTVVLWGPFKSTTLFPMIEDFNLNNPAYIVQYVEKSPETFDRDLLEALAEGKGPDMFFLPDNLAFRYENKILPIPYNNISIASFQNGFAGAGEVFLTDNGILAMPITIDPLILYFNRSILDANNIVYPPAYWDEFVNMTSVLTKKDQANKIEESMVALGQFANISHAKNIISMMLMQAGNPIVTQRDGFFVSALDGNSNAYDLGSILKFYTNFADPLSQVYSWNRSFPNSTNAFSSEKLAFYFGFGSEFAPLVNKNPNHNFSIAPVPQIQGAKFKLTSAKVTGIAISAFSKNINTAFTAANAMSTGDFASRLSSALGVAPARRDLLKNVPKDEYSNTIYASALFARSWLDPSPTDTDNIFRGMVDAVLSNNLTPTNAISDASSKLDLLLFK